MIMRPKLRNTYSKDYLAQPEYMLLGFSGRRKRNWMKPLKGIQRTGPAHFWEIGIQGLNIKEQRTTDSLSSHDHLPSDLLFCLQPEEHYLYYIPCEWWSLELCEAIEISHQKKNIRKSWPLFVPLPCILQPCIQAYIQQPFAENCISQDLV